MNVGLITCGFMCLSFLAMAGLFAVLRGKGACLISGFNTMPCHCCGRCVADSVFQRCSFG